MECGVKGYEKQIERERKGGCPLYKPNRYRCEERQKKKNLKKTSWYKPFDRVLFYQPTPEGKLARQLREIADETYKMMLMKSD